jgi:serine/threonine protein kinase
MNFGRYEIERELGRGSMGIVYQAHDPRLDRRVALKVLKADLVASETFVQRFLKEARAVARLTHPNIVSIYDADEDQGTIYIAMELLAGESLDKLIRKRKFSEREIVLFGIQMAQILDYAHQRGIIHRDIKPGNIVLDPNGQIKITDFGVARIEDPSAPQQTMAGEVLGTPAYMSPEQALGRRVDGRTDIYSLGVVLYELSTGVRPFRGKTLSAILMAIIHDIPPEPKTINAAISPDLARIIMRCMGKTADERFQTGKALAEALERLVREEEALAPPVPFAKKSPRRLGLFFVIFLLSLGIGGGLFYQFLTKRSKPGVERPIAEPIAPMQEQTKPAPAGKPETTPELEEAKRRIEELEKRIAETRRKQDEADRRARALQEARRKPPTEKREVGSVSKSEKVDEAKLQEQPLAKEALEKKAGEPGQEAAQIQQGAVSAEAGFPPIGTRYAYRIVTEQGTYKRSFTVVEDAVFEKLTVHRVQMKEKDVVNLYDVTSENWMAQTRDGKIEMLAKPHDDLFRFPLYVGQKHQAKFSFTKQGKRKIVVQWIEVKSFEKVTVPAGTFDAFRIQVESPEVKKTFWYAPELRIPVKRVDEHLREGKSTRELTEYRAP